MIIGRNLPYVLTLLVATASAADPPKVLQQRAGQAGNAWNTLDFLDLTNRPTTVEGYGITDIDIPAIMDAMEATAADRVQTGLDAAATAADRLQTTHDRETLNNHTYVALQFLWGIDDRAVPFVSSMTMRSPTEGLLSGMVCDVLSAPVGGDIVLDLWAGSPPASVYPTGQNPRIVAGDTTTLTGTPEMLVDPVEIPWRGAYTMKVLSAPGDHGCGLVATVGELPVSTLTQIGVCYVVLANRHKWTRAQVWSDTGVYWTGGAAPNAASLPTENPPPVGSLVAVLDTKKTYQWTGSTWTDLGVGFVDSVTINTDLHYSGTVGDYWRISMDNHRWQVVSDPWVDGGEVGDPGRGLSCSVYFYPQVN